MGLVSTVGRMPISLGRILPGWVPLLFPVIPHTLWDGCREDYQWKLGKWHRITARMQYHLHRLNWPSRGDILFTLANR